MEKKILLEQYTKYLKAIKSCKKEEIPMNYKKIMSFIEKNTEAGDFYLNIKFNTIKETLAQAVAKELNFKQVSTEWSKKAVIECAKLIKLLETSFVPYAPEPIDMDAYKVNTYKLFKLIESQTDPSLQLYLYLMHSNSKDGKNMYKKMEAPNL